nr:MAG TPA: hypothetical protein [Caudoviricetes sp.]
MQTELKKIVRDWCTVLRYFTFNRFDQLIGMHISQRVQSTSIKRQPVQGTDAIKQNQILSVP